MYSSWMNSLVSGGSGYCAIRRLARSVSSIYAFVNDEDEAIEEWGLAGGEDDRTARGGAV